MKHKVLTSWKGNMKFESELDSHKITIDASPEHGGENAGPTPKKLMLTALAGCTGIDVVSILTKMRVPFTGLNIVVEGDVTEEHPKHYQSMHIIYEFSGENLDLEKLEKAVQLSQQKYCGVSHVYRKAVNMTYEIKVIS